MVGFWEEAETDADEMHWFETLDDLEKAEIRETEFWDAAPSLVEEILERLEAEKRELEGRINDLHQFMKEI